jgi:membrane protease YdiL (CAAX protease family)
MSAYLDLARRGRIDWWRYAVTPIVALVLWVFAIAALYVPAFIAHLVPLDFTQHALDPSHPADFYGFAGLTFGGLLIAFWFAIRLIHGKGFMDIIGAWKWRQFAAGAGLWLALSAAASAIDYLVQPAGFRLTLGPQTLTLALVAAPMLAIQTFCEEFVFRGYVTQGLALAIKRPMPAAAVSAVVFASLHIPNGWPEAANALVFGFITALIVMKTGNLAFTWGIHVVNNVFGAVVVVSTSDVLHGSPGIFAQTTPGLLWLDVAASTLAFAIAWLWISRGSREATVPETVS